MTLPELRELAEAAKAWRPDVCRAGCSGHESGKDEHGGADVVRCSGCEPCEKCPSCLGDEAGCEACDKGWTVVDRETFDASEMPGICVHRKVEDAQ